MMALKIGLFLTLFLFTLEASRTKDLSGDNSLKNKYVKYKHFNKASRAAMHLSAVWDSLILNRLRVKRSALFSTGVKACPQENMTEVIASHISYYTLRVCQEAVWEAFQIFLDRIPDTTEFQQWVDACQTDSLCVKDLAHNFSSTQEHHDMVARRVSIQDHQKHAMGTSVPGEKCLDAPKEKLAMDSEKTKVSAVRHIIEFSVTVKDPGYSQLQRDPDNFLNQDVHHSLHEQMLQIFDKLAGFKEIRLLGFHPGSVAVRYAVEFETKADSTRIGSSGTIVKSGTEISLKDMVLKALREDTSLALDVNSFSFEPTTLNHFKDLAVDKPEHLPGKTTNNSEEAATLNGTQGKDKEATEGTFPTQETYKHFPTVTTLVTLTGSSPPKSSGGPTLKEVEEQNLNIKAEGYKRNTSLDSLSKVPEVNHTLGNEIDVMPSSLNLNFNKASTSSQYSLVDVLKDSLKEEISVTPAEEPKTEGTAGDITGAMGVLSETLKPSSFTRSSEAPSTKKPIEFSLFRTEDSIQSASIPQSVSSAQIPSLPSPISGKFLDKKGQSIHTHSPHQTKACDCQDLIEGLPSDKGNPQSSVLSLDKDVGMIVILQFTNMIFSEDRLNRSSPGYRFLENTFLELRQSPESSNLQNPDSSSNQTEKAQQTLASIPLLQFLQSNLTGFKELHLNFSDGRVVVNNKTSIAKPVVSNITMAVHCTLDNFSNSASKRMDSEIDTHSDDHDDPCRYMECNEFSHCVVKKLTTEAECLCDPGYSTVDGLPCQSICILQPNYCLNGGLCENIAGHGASCRCPAGKYWYYKGERCSELVSVPVDPLTFVLCLMASLTVVCAVIGLLVFINRRCIRKRKMVTLVHSRSPLSMDRIMRVNPVFENDDSILTHVSSISYPTITDSGSPQPSDQGSFCSLENMHLSIEIPKKLYTTRSEKLVSKVVGFHHCIPNVKTWRLSNEHGTSCCLLGESDCDGFEVTVL